jgi:hypothetical protein
VSLIIENFHRDGQQNQIKYHKWQLIFSKVKFYLPLVKRKTIPTISNFDFIAASVHSKQIIGHALYVGL